MQFPRMKHVGYGRFKQKRLPRCKCQEPDGPAGGVCRACGLAALTVIEKAEYRRAYPTSARLIDDGIEP